MKNQIILDVLAALRCPKQLEADLLGSNDPRSPRVVLCSDATRQRSRHRAADVYELATPGVSRHGTGCWGEQRRRAATVAQVPSRRGLRSRPSDYLSPGGVWPAGPFDADTPREAFFVVGVARRLRDLCDEVGAHGVTVTDVAQRANLSTQAVFNLLEGKTWGDLPSIYRLEVALGAVLWHNRDISGP